MICIKVLTILCERTGLAAALAEAEFIECATLTRSWYSSVSSKYTLIYTESLLLLWRSIKNDLQICYIW